jgi:hypothetical protein
MWMQRAFHHAGAFCPQGLMSAHQGCKLRDAEGIGMIAGG